MILYVVSDRGARAKSAGRKTVSIQRTWRDMGYEVESVFGGDVASEPASASSGGGGGSRWRSRLVSTPDLKGLHAPLVHSLSEWKDMQHDKLLAAKLAAMLADRKPELIWHRASRLHLTPLHLAQKLGVPYALEWIDRLVDYPISLFRRRAIAADFEQMREAHHVIVTSERWKLETAEEYGIPLDKIIVAQNAVEPSEFTRDEEAGRRVREKLGIPPDSFVAGFVGSYGWYHEAHILVEAAALLRDRLPEPVWLLLVGDGPHRWVTDQRARELDVEDIAKRVDYVPHDEVPQYLSAMNAAVVPANGGQIICPMKVQEYMAASLCPVVADSAANREVVTHGTTGLLFESGDPRAMADALEELAREPERAAALGRAGREEVIARFSWRDTFGRALAQILPR